MTAWLKLVYRKPKTNSKEKLSACFNNMDDKPPKQVSTGRGGFANS